MSKIKYGLFDGRADVLSYTDSISAEIELEFPKNSKGYLQIGEITKKLKDGKCSVLTKNLPLDEYTPVLTLEDGRVVLPPIRRRGNIFSPIPPDEDYIRALSLRELKLAQRVRELESKISQIEKKVYGTTIF